MKEQHRYLVTDQIVMALRQGDHKAYEVIFTHYFPKVKYYIHGYMKSEVIAEELAQEVFARLWENHRALNPSVKSLTSYLFTIAYRITIDWVRGRHVRESFYNDQSKCPEETTSVEEDYIARETRQRLEGIIREMPARQQEIFRMSRYMELDNDEIAQRLSISKRTVENQLSLAVKKIKTAFLEES
jgi:RNA polymerase sigma-70 factor (ECF subfamily)